MSNPLNLFKKISTLDFLVFIVLFAMVSSGALLILKAQHSSPTEIAAEVNGIPIITEIAGRSVEPTDNTKPVGEDNPQAIKDELLVMIPDKAGLAQFGDRIEPIEDLPDIYRLRVDGAGTLEQKQAEVAQKPGVEIAEPNYIIHATEPPQPPPNRKPVAKFNRWQWSMIRIQAHDAWNVTRGSGVTVAVIDSGVRGDHVELKNGMIGPHKSFVPKGTSTRKFGNDNYVCHNDGNALHDFDGHGTAVASIITAAGDRVGMAGVAPAAKIMALQSIDCWGYGEAVFTYRAIWHAADNGADVINMSLGWFKQYDPDACKLLGSAVRHALAKNVSVVASSGNEREGPVKCPANIDGVVAVGAIDRYNNLVSNSTWGSSWGKEQSVVAPGIQVAAADSNMKSWIIEKDKNKYKGPAIGYNSAYKLKFNGTSAAAPHVAGVAALIKSINPKLSPAQVKDIIQKTATNPGSHAGKLPNSSYGYGVVNAYGAAAYTQQYFKSSGGQ